jgi:hypothetical protein
MCLAVYTLTGGPLLQGRMVMTVAQQLGITFDHALKLAEAAAKAGPRAASVGAGALSDGAGVQLGGVQRAEAVAGASSGRKMRADAQQSQYEIALVCERWASERLGD